MVAAIDVQRLQLKNLPQIADAQRFSALIVSDWSAKAYERYRKHMLKTAAARICDLRTRLESLVPAAATKSTSSQFGTQKDRRASDAVLF